MDPKKANVLMGQAIVELNSTSEEDFVEFLDCKFEDILKMIRKVIKQAVPNTEERKALTMGQVMDIVDGLDNEEG